MPDFLTPPVHDHCRCFIGPDDVWYDAQDARVCVRCMLLGASWNLRLDVPMSPGEVAELLDEQTLNDFRKAVEADSSLADKVIQQAGESVESGVIKNVVNDKAALEKAKRAALIAKNKQRLAKLKELRKAAKIALDKATADAAKAATPEAAKVAQTEEADAANEIVSADNETVALEEEIKQAQAAGAETLDAQIEKETVKAKAEARAKAAIPLGRIVPGLGATPDALVFESTPVGKVARLVSVNVASGQAYRVIWRGGKYLLQTVGGRTIDSDDDLWWLLLLLALMEKKRRDDLERERLAREALTRQ